MKVKGVSIISTKEFVIGKFGQEGYTKWLNALPQASAKLMEDTPLASVWYPFDIGMLEPTKVLCDVFYEGRFQGAEEIGAYSAEKSLRGIYKVFVRVASPDTLLKRAAQLFQSYYSPSNIEIENVAKNHYIIRFSEFDPPSPFIEYRVIGWIIKALEICGAKNIRMSVKKHAKVRTEFSELIVKWE